MAGALVSFTTSALSVRALARTLAVFEILSLRAAGGLAVLAVALALSPALRSRFRLHRPWLHLVRNVPHTAGQAAWSTALTALPLATVFALEFTSPVWLTLLAVPLLGERLTPARIAAVLLGLLGVLVILRPGTLPVSQPSLLALGAAFAFAVTGVATKALTRTESTISILFWMNAIQLPLNLLASDLGFLGRIESSQAVPLAAFCVSGLTSHLCLTQAYRHGDAILVIPLDFLRVPLIALVGARFFGEPLDPYVFAGAALILAGIVGNLVGEARAVRARATAARLT